MKKIRHSSLRMQQGNTDKVYEVEIIERLSGNDARYLVNFRHGRYDAYLQEGSKTRQPVALAEAEQLFNSVIVAQVNKGFVVVSGDNPLATTATSSNITPASQQQTQAQQVSAATESQGTASLATRQQAVFRQFMQLRATRKENEY